MSYIFIYKIALLAQFLDGERDTSLFALDGY